VAAIPAIIFAFIFISPLMAGVTALFYFLVQQLENNILVPKIMSDNADVNPLVSIVTILIGLKMAGFLGALLAIPAYIIFRTAYSFWFNSRA
jgi:predicted PurR-regulated permease PerM